jgi:DNA-binding NtrC family response regulator
VELSLPPLRDRKEDIPLLIEHFIKKFSKKFNREIIAVTDDVRKIFMNYPWPGNVRELEHALEHAFIICRQPTAAIDHLPPELQNYSVSPKASTFAGGDSEQTIIQRSMNITSGRMLRTQKHNK